MIGYECPIFVADVDEVAAAVKANAGRILKGNAGHVQPLLSSVTGLDLGGFSLATIVVAVFFGLVGFAAFRYGKKNGEPRQLFLGIALMAYGYSSRMPGWR